MVKFAMATDLIFWSSSIIVIPLERLRPKFNLIVCGYFTASTQLSPEPSIPFFFFQIYYKFDSNWIGVTVTTIKKTLFGTSRKLFYNVSLKK